MVECGFLKALTLRNNGDLSPNDLGESITNCDPVMEKQEKSCEEIYLIRI